MEPVSLFSFADLSATGADAATLQNIPCLEGNPLMVQQNDKSFGSVSCKTGMTEKSTLKRKRSDEQLTDLRFTYEHQSVSDLIDTVLDTGLNERQPRT